MAPVLAVAGMVARTVDAEGPLTRWRDSSSFFPRKAYSTLTPMVARPGLPFHPQFG